MESLAASYSTHLLLGKVELFNSLAEQASNDQKQANESSGKNLFSKQKMDKYQG